MTKTIKFDHTLAQAIVDTIREPLLVLDEDLRVVTASRSFYSTFKVIQQDTDGRLLDALGDGQWDITALRDLLMRISPDQTVLEGYEVELDFPHIGRRFMLLNARKVFYEARGHTTILLAFEDVTVEREIQRQRDQLLRDKDLLLQEIQAIVDTIRGPLLVLDEDLRVVTASRSFCSTFKVMQQDTDGRLLDELGDGQWDITALRELLMRISRDHTVLEGYEVELDFPHIGRRCMLLNARKVFYEARGHTTILLAFEDITEEREIQRQRDQLLRDKDLLLQEMQHRVANSLQIIASILLLKARNVTSEETREHLRDAHKRVLAVAAVQKHLHATVGNDTIDLPHYLPQLCGSLADSMIGEERPIVVAVNVHEGRVTSHEAVSIGLVVTELLINALKHAFPTNAPGSTITVAYAVDGPGWRLSVADNGAGKAHQPAPTRVGLGTSIVAALAQQLDATVETISGDTGTTVSVIRAAPVVAASA